MKSKKCIVIPFLTFIVFWLVVFLAHKKQDYSELEKRTLAQRPTFSVTAYWDGSFAESITTYLSDQFPFRSKWMQLQYNMQRMEGNQETESLIFGKDGYLFLKPTRPEEEVLKKTTEQINQFLAKNETLPAYFVLVPNSSVVLQDKLPFGAPVHDQAADIDHFLLDLSAPNLTSFSVTESLQDVSGDDLYYKTDHHWTTDAAFSVFQEIAPELSIDALPSYTRYTVSDSFYGTLSAKSGHQGNADTIHVFLPDRQTNSFVVDYPDQLKKSTSAFEENALLENDPYTVFFGGNHPLVQINSTNLNDRHLLILKDSFANCFVPFLAPYYESISMVDPRYYYEDLQQLIQNENITDIMFLYSADTLFSDTSLAMVLSKENE